MPHTLVQVGSQKVQGAFSLQLCLYGVLIGVLFCKICRLIRSQVVIPHTKDEGDAGGNSRIAQDAGQQTTALGFLFLDAVVFRQSVVAASFCGGDWRRALLC